MTEELRAKLAEEVLRNASWEDLRPHIIRGVVFLLRDVALLDGGVALALDDKEKVTGWIEGGKIARPEPEEMARWVDEKTRFAILIVAPFVLCQEEAPDLPEPVESDV